MKEEFVTYSQAVKLKELGFDWKVEYSYTDVIKESAREKWDEEECQWCTVYDINYYPKPRLDQAQKWLRDVKGIDIEPRVWLVGNKREYRPYVMPPKCKDYIACPPEESYEKALSSGINEALELLTDKLNGK